MPSSASVVMTSTSTASPHLLQGSARSVRVTFAMVIILAANVDLVRSTRRSFRRTARHQSKRAASGPVIRDNIGKVEPRIANAATSPTATIT